MPHEQLLSYFREMIPSASHDKSIPRGASSLPREEQRQIGRLRVEKTRLLDKQIFPAMADLVYFFEATALDSRARESFDNDIKDLLGIGIGVRNANRLHSIEGNAGDEINTVFARLTTCIIDPENSDSDYRLRLAHRLQIIVAEKILLSILDKYGEESPVFTAAFDELKKTISWTRFAAELATDDDKEHEQKRLITIPSPEELRPYPIKPMEERRFKLGTLRRKLGV